MNATRLVEISTTTHDVDLDLVYATDRNLTGRPIYRHARCLLLEPAEAALRRAIDIARGMDLRLRIYDAFRPSEAQQMLWDRLPDPGYVADPSLGSNHTRGTAIDLTLIDLHGTPLDMGTGFDEMTGVSAHFQTDLPAAIQRNRILLLGVMHAAGFAHIPNEWWHYELPDSRGLPLLADGHGNAPLLMK